MTHVCTLDEYGTCTDQTRDWCNQCNRCTPWSGEFCSVCGLEWGEDPKGVR